MTFVAAASIIGGASVLSAGASIYTGNKANKAIKKGNREALAFNAEAQAAADRKTKPYEDAGVTALDRLMMLSGLESPQSVKMTTAGDFGGLGFDPDKPMTADEIRRAYQVVLGRDPDPEGLDHYLSMAPKEGGGRRAHTFNEFLEGTVAGPEYEEKTASGQIPRFSWENLQGTAVQERRAGAATTPAEMVKQDPGYQFRLDEGMRAYGASAAARGGFGTPFDRKVTRYAQDYASNEYQKIVDRIAMIAGYGTRASESGANRALAYGQQAGNLAQDTAYTRASAYQATGNAVAGAIGEAARGVGYYYQSKQPKATDYSQYY